MELTTFSFKLFRRVLEFRNGLFENEDALDEGFEEPVPCEGGTKPVASEFGAKLLLRQDFIERSRFNMTPAYRTMLAVLSDQFFVFKLGLFLDSHDGLL